MLFIVFIQDLGGRTVKFVNPRPNTTEMGSCTNNKPKWLFQLMNNIIYSQEIQKTIINGVFIMYKMKATIIITGVQ
jgi:hypothetical protein